MKDYVLWHNMPDMHLHWMLCDLSMHEKDSYIFKYK